MTNGELTDRLANIAPPHIKVNCLEMGENGRVKRIFDVVNVHEDLTGVHVIVELWGGPS